MKKLFLLALTAFTLMAASCKKQPTVESKQSTADSKQPTEESKQSILVKILDGMLPMLSFSNKSDSISDFNFINSCFNIISRRICPIRG